MENTGFKKEFRISYLHKTLDRTAILFFYHCVDTCRKISDYLAFNHLFKGINCSFLLSNLYFT